MTRVPTNENFHTAPVGGHLTIKVIYNVHQAYIHCGSSLESRFQPGTLRPRSQELATRPPRIGVGIGRHGTSCSFTMHTNLQQSI
ncbi:hypothetical protein AVEN_156864-1 [Araneus ventricosus]|uniref:Uncharacterized protein n=1 Tax=Araneus ventricosus TaxID=182803 RepID=A0A4Y2UKA4_ARAVE|nr:hypothetical protein AVEN_156864-1 [Araneus ventricosus]